MAGLIVLVAIAADPHEPALAIRAFSASGRFLGSVGVNPLLRLIPAGLIEVLLPQDLPLRPPLPRWCRSPPRGGS